MTETSATSAPDGSAGTTPVPQERWPAGRYGRRREARPTSKVAVAAAALALAAVTGFIGVRLFHAYGETDYAASVTSFSDVTEHQVVVTFQVRLPAEGSATCLVRARNAQGAETGRAEIAVGPGPDPARTVVTHRLTTRDRPVTGEVQGCRPA